MLLARAVVAFDTHRRVERIGEDREPETPVGNLVVVLIVEDHVHRHDASAVVAPDGGRESGEIRVRYYGVANIVDGARIPVASHELVRPQHVVLPSGVDRARYLERRGRAA